MLKIELLSVHVGQLAQIALVVTLKPPVNLPAQALPVKVPRIKGHAHPILVALPVKLLSVFVETRLIAAYQQAAKLSFQIHPA